MKKHAIIPIFIPHLGCPHTCVFCNQNSITARPKPVSAEDVRRTAETWLSTLEGRGLDVVELSFYGGSFTAIPMEMQNEYLAVAKEYKDRGRIKKIHMSTRPDAIDERILDNLKSYGADVIELGVQSFDDEVLRLSERGHDAACVYRACELIKDYGFELGIQLMVGLPGDSPASSVFSAQETARIKPELARLYPTVLLRDTALFDMYLAGSYKPLTVEEAVARTKEMYKIIAAAGINIMRVGLKATDIINENSDTVVAETFHPAFRQLVEGEIAKDEIDEQLSKMPQEAEISLLANEKCFSNLVGHQSRNKAYFAEKYPEKHLRYLVEPTLKDYEYVATPF